MSYLLNITTEAYQHNILQDILYMCLLSLFIAIPLYRFIKKQQPSFQEPIGNVDTTHFNAYDTLIALVLILPFCVTLLLPYKPKPAELSDASNFGLLLAFSVPIVLSAIATTILAFRSPLTNIFGIQFNSLTRAIIIGLLAYLLMVILVIAMAPLGLESWLENRLGEKQNQDVVNEVLNSTNSSRLIILIFGACILAPITEEIIFRSYLYPAIKKLTSPFYAIIFTGILFGVVHGQVWAIIPISLLGIIIAIAYEFSGSILTCIFTHFLFNSVNVFFMLNADKFQDF